VKEPPYILWELLAGRLVSVVNGNDNASFLFEIYIIFIMSNKYH
jgi:hypothetical protein